MEEEIRCKGLVNTERWPYGKRCENERAEGSEICQPHIDAGYELN